MDQKTIAIAPGEAWYGLCVWDGCQMPITQASVYSRSLEPNPTANQSAPLFVSSHGRYLWCDTGLTVDIRDGVIHASSGHGALELKEGFDTLRGAYLAAAAAHFPPQGKLPPEAFFTSIIPGSNWLMTRLRKTCWPMPGVSWTRDIQRASS